MELLGRRVTRLPKLPQASQLFLHFLTKRGKPLRGNKKSARPEGWSSFFDGRVTLQDGPTFFLINTLARPVGSTRSRRDNLSMRERCCLGRRGQICSLINVCLCSLCWEVDSLFQDSFFPISQTTLGGKGRIYFQYLNDKHKNDTRLWGVFE